MTALGIDTRTGHARCWILVKMDLATIIEVELGTWSLKHVPAAQRMLIKRKNANQPSRKHDAVRCHDGYPLHDGPAIIACPDLYIRSKTLNFTSCNIWVQSFIIVVEESIAIMLYMAADLTAAEFTRDEVRKTEPSALNHEVELYKTHQVLFYR